MTDDHDDLTTPDVEPDGFEEEAPPRSIFTTAWFRALVVVIAVSGLGVIAAPYILDWLNPPPPAVATVPPAVVVVPPAEPAVGTTTVVPAPPPGPPPAAQDGPAAPAGETGAVADRVPALEPAGPAADQAPAVVPETTAPPAPVERVRPNLAPPAPARAATKRKAMAKAEAKPEQAVEVPARAAVAKASAGSGTWWVQIGSFRDEESARRLAARLREQSFTVAESVRSAAPAPAKAAALPEPAPQAASGADQYDVYVSGVPPADLTQRVTERGLSAEASGNDSVVVRPSLPLREAVMLSKELALGGLRVQVKRAPRAGAAAPPPPAEAISEQTWHRVRIGPFPDREAAQTALQDAQAKGYKPFLARGDG